MARFPIIRTPESLVGLVEEIGFLPFFQHDIPGFSVEDCTPKALWFTRSVEGPWEWREELAESRQCIYGKFFHGKTGLVSLAWFPHLANYRRNGYDFDARWDEGLANYREKRIMDALERNGACLSPSLRALSGVEKGKGGWFETTMTRLQMQCYALPRGFVFTRDRDGHRSGYGTALFDTAERWLGQDTCTAEYRTAPADSYRMMLEQLNRVLPDVDEPSLARLLR